MYTSYVEKYRPVVTKVLRAAFPDPMVERLADQCLIESYFHGRGGEGDEEAEVRDLFAMIGWQMLWGGKLEEPITLPFVGRAA